MSTYSNLTLCIPRGSADALSRPVVVQSAISKPLPPNHVLLRVERFGFSSNNVTYGVLGEDKNLRYYDYHPAPETPITSPATHGVIPAWGFGTIVASTHASIEPGERVFGYFAMSRYLLLPVEPAVNAFNFYVPRPTLPDDRRTYNQVTRCAADPLYNRQREDEITLYRPLFWASFWCEDYLVSKSSSTNLYDGATHVLISSASAKTAFCFAYLVQKRARGKVTVVGLTSPRNVSFTKHLGHYDMVIKYDQLETLPGRDQKWIYVDVAGNHELNNRVFKHFGASLIKAVALGSTNLANSAPSFPSSPDRLSMEKFFMPGWLAARRKELPVQKIARMQKEGWDALMRDCPPWVKLEQAWGPEKFLPLYDECVKGRVGADRALIFSMWDGVNELDMQIAKL